MDRVVVAAVQATPVFLDRGRTTDKVVRLIGEAGGKGARLVVFPETFIPCYPDWIWRASAWDEPFDSLDAMLRDQAVDVPGPVTMQVGEAAREAAAYVSVGVNERVGASGTLFNTQLMFGPDGTLLGGHRKLVPTGPERIAWGMGDGSDLQVIDTSFGRIGGLICWENFMPLARAAMYAKGVDIWTAPTIDDDDNWVATLRHIAREGRVYVIGVGTVLRGSDIPADLPGRDLWGGAEDVAINGYSAIVDPEGEVLAGPLAAEEGILYAEVDAAKARAARYKFDPVGHYSRPDVFRLVVDESPKPGIASVVDGSFGDEEVGG